GAAVAAGTTFVALSVALWPLSLALGTVAVGVLLGVFVYARPGAATRRFARWIGLASAVALIALASALWPVTVALGAITLAVLVLAWRKPPVALASAVLLVGFEGSTKILLGLEPTPLPFSDRA